ncbi:hypothetical protein DFH07DRAFT_1031895 [Mycena maculata]|uniref:Uncharacterized protein n=1 Tax=Mycena maculata TaxID=230809 RepID=A0AAD7IX48_9AGAR|nr:hypothetical protein DFH07DRAFT_1031895 [Mycena maculata]
MQCATKMSDAPPTVEQAITGLASITLNPDTSGNDSDSTGSVPDLVPASDSDNEADKDTSDDVSMPPATPVTHADNRAVNGNAQHIQVINAGLPARRAPIHHHFDNGLGHGGPANHVHAGTQTAEHSPNQNWRGPAHLANQAFRSAFADRFTNQGFVHHGPIGNNFRRGGAPYQVIGGRALNGEMIYDLVFRLQRLERALQGLADSAEQHWLPRQF